jgi:hypothetical protein
MVKPKGSMHCGRKNPPGCGGFLVTPSVLLPTKQGFQVATAVYHAKNQHVSVLNAINDHVLTYGETP